MKKLLLSTLALSAALLFPACETTEEQVTTTTTTEETLHQPTRAPATTETRVIRSY